jgi:SPP1 gp7 family putative phage head morphogenesis protein
MARLDRTGRRSRWEMARDAERSYSAKLKLVARQIDHIVRGELEGLWGHIGATPATSAEQVIDDFFARRVQRVLGHYAEALDPWAQSVARFMLADVSRRNERTWKNLSREIGRALWVEIQQAPTGMVFSALMADQVALIKSLPIQAGRRVHDIVVEGMAGGRRPADIARDVLETGRVTKSRATLIARTEVSRAAATFTQARAMFAGSEGYVWRTSRDEAVRKTHRKMEAKFVPWEQPPKTDKNLEPYHAGCGPNCRCFPEPILPDFNE